MKFFFESNISDVSLSLIVLYQPHFKNNLIRSVSTGRLLVPERIAQIFIEKKPARFLRYYLLL
jgi:hypothetical protein